jgi:hypothetical protein
MVNKSPFNIRDFVWSEAPVFLDTESDLTDRYTSFPIYCSFTISSGAATVQNMQPRIGRATVLS